MANLIENFFNVVDDVTSAALGADAVNAVIAEITPIFYAFATIGLIVIVANGFLQWRPIPISDVFKWMLRTIIIGTFALNYANLEVIYNVIESIPVSISNTILTSTGSDSYANYPSIIAGISDGIETVQLSIVDNAGWISGGIFAVVFMVIGYSFLAIASGVYLLSTLFLKIMFLLLPIIILLFMIDAFKSFAEGFIKVIVAFMIAPIMVSVVIAIVISSADLVDTQDEYTFSYVSQLVFVYIMGILFTIITPVITMAVTGAGGNLVGTALSASGVTAGGRALQRKAGEAASATGGAAMRGAGAATDRVIGGAAQRASENYQSNATKMARRFSQIKGRSG